MSYARPPSRSSLETTHLGWLIGAGSLGAEVATPGAVGQQPAVRGGRSVAISVPLCDAADRLRAILKRDTCFQFRAGIVRFTAAHLLCAERGDGKTVASID